MADSLNQSELKYYGVTQNTTASTAVDACVESIRRKGYAVLDPSFSSSKIVKIGESFDQVQSDYISLYGKSYLQSINEHNTVRLPMSFDLQGMLEIALNDDLMSVVDRMIDGTFILNQQNLISNPSKKEYNQSAWHRDLPYQHFTSSTPLAINAIYCVDDFTAVNGASFLLPCSHRVGEFPSNGYVTDNQVQIVASAGTYLVLDCMTFHRGGYNQTKKPRRAINQVFTIPYFKQQISISGTIQIDGLDSRTQAILGAGFLEPASTKDYLKTRATS